MLNFWKQAIKVLSSMFRNCEGNIFLLIKQSVGLFFDSSLGNSNLVGSEFQRNKGGPCNTLKIGSKDSRAFDRGLMGPKNEKSLIFPSFRLIRYGNCAWNINFNVSQIKVKLEKTEGSA